MSGATISIHAMQKTWVRSLGGEDLLEKEMATHSSILGKSRGQRSLVGYSPQGRRELNTTERLHFHFQDCFWSKGCIKKQEILRQPQNHFGLQTDPKLEL